MKKRYIVFGVIGILVVIGAMSGGNDSGSPSSSTASSGATAVPPVDVTASTLSSAFQENEAKAQLTYKDKALRVSGTINDIDLDFSDKPVIKLRGANDVQGMGISSDGKITDVSISGLPNEAAADLKKGQKLTVVCHELGEVMGSAQLQDCSLSK